MQNLVGFCQAPDQCFTFKLNVEVMNGFPVDATLYLKDTRVFSRSSLAYKTHGKSSRLLTFTEVDEQ